MARVSVVLTIYNGASRGFLARSIESVLSQTFTDFELILVDDGSTDSTPELCGKYLKDARVRYVRQTNRGVASARNRGIRDSSGEFVCFLDDDDEWTATKLEKQVQEFECAGPRPGLVYTAIQLIDQTGRPVGLQRHAVPPNPYTRLFYENFIDATSSVMIRSDVFDSVGMFLEDVYGPELQGCEDRDLWIRIARRFPVRGIHEPLVLYRLPTGRQQLSRNVAQMERSEIAMLDIALRDAPPEIKDQKNLMLASTIHRIAMEYFALGDYRKFRARVGTLKALGGAGPGMRLRALISFFPAAVSLARIAARAMERRNNGRAGNLSPDLGS